LEVKSFSEDDIAWRLKYAHSRGFIRPCLAMPTRRQAYGEIPYSMRSERTKQHGNERRITWNKMKVKPLGWVSDVKEGLLFE
jgi:hypothetical protein